MPVENAVIENLASSLIREYLNRKVCYSFSAILILFSTVCVYRAKFYLSYLRNSFHIDSHNFAII